VEFDLGARGDGGEGLLVEGVEGRVPAQELRDVVHADV
jgi:hypothetical protein